MLAPNACVGAIANDVWRRTTTAARRRACLDPRVGARQHDGKKTAHGVPECPDPAAIDLGLLLQKADAAAGTEGNQKPVVVPRRLEGIQGQMIGRKLAVVAVVSGLGGVKRPPNLWLDRPVRPAPSRARPS